MISEFKAKGYVFVPKTTSGCEKVFVKLHTYNAASYITVEFFPKCIMFGKGLHFTGYSYIYTVWVKCSSCYYDLQHTIQELLCEKGIRLTDAKLPKAYTDEEYENVKTLTDSLEMLYRMSESVNTLDGIVVF